MNNFSFVRSRPHHRDQKTHSPTHTHAHTHTHACARTHTHACAHTLTHAHTAERVNAIRGRQAITSQYSRLCCRVRCSGMLTPLQKIRPARLISSFLGAPGSHPPATNSTDRHESRDHGISHVPSHPPLGAGCEKAILLL